MGSNDLTRFSQDVDPLVIVASELRAHHLETLLQANIDSPFLALSAAYGVGRKLEYLAFVHDGNQPLVVKLHFPTTRKRQHFKTIVNNFLGVVTGGSAKKFIAYNADILAAGLYLDCGVRLKQCINVHTILEDEEMAFFSYTRTVIREVYDKDITYPEYRTLFDDRTKCRSRLVALVGRGTMALMIGARTTGTVPQKAIIDVSRLSEKVLVLVARLLRDADCLETLKPIVKKHGLASAQLQSNGDLAIVSSRFSTRVQMHQGQQISKIKFSTSSKAVTARTKGVKGKTGTFKVSQAPKKPNSKIRSVTTIGKDAAPVHEVDARQIMRLVLSGRKATFTSNLLICRVFGLPDKPLRASPHFPTCYSPSRISFKLNPSQHRAVQAFCSSEHLSGPLIQLVHGPPGTGKTTLIASIIQGLACTSEAIYACAQSNVAVKNIAEKLTRAGFTKFKLLVSEDFYHEWHEHLYEGVSANLIQSSKIPKDTSIMERKLGKARVVLCTLAMLSSPRLETCGLMTELLQPTTMIIDEASQIPLGDYLPSFHQFNKTVKRICFVGDHKQLPPYGQNQVPTLKSVFEMEHLTRDAFLLDTQYRMPHPIGNFISKNVYDGKLQTQHKISAWSCCRFVNVEGVEEEEGKSTKNLKEARHCVRIARQLKDASYCIITPYDAQRQMIENMLKEENLRWEHKVFNVDSFQGSEADFIIISVVRTKSPGFLVDERRSNVMLTRCKKGMVILTNRRFLSDGKTRGTLIYKLSQTMREPWIAEGDILNGRPVFT